MSLKKWFSSMIVFALALLTPVITAAAAGNGDGNGEEEAVGWITQLPLAVMAFATIIIMIYYTIRD
ncbi:hypothetical protein CR205_06090 [Alteribacter lacisalsi]|uniref:Uncharacterized protein n=1 Tax=Alteribacter lacisalsi TaxID=2045244 RepID=A0A2W0H8H4_9BACI|nr:hypothetical protein [Alteribacter lacisalsi]PYZ98163.1 hypothetical protein CR205_06090 [Alteribacter lacisalsi]